MSLLVESYNPTQGTTDNLMLRHEDVVGVTAEVGGQLTDIEETFV